ncbi:unnamed protein product [Rangifer tarandus platyrhynchus]
MDLPTLQFSSVQSLSRVRLFATPRNAARQASLSITDSWSLLKLMSIQSVMLSNHLILCCPLFLPPSIFPSIRIFSNGSVLHISQFRCSVVSDSLPPHEPQHTRPPCPSPTPRVHPKPMSIELIMPSNHLILWHPLLLLPSIFPSIGVFSNESDLHIRGPKYWSFSFNISPSNEHPGLISFRMDWLDLLAVQGTLKSLLQHHSSKASILRHSAFFIVQLSYPYMTTGKTIALTRCTFVGKVMSLLFNMLSSLVITFLPRSKRLLISCLQSPSAVILEPPKIVSHCFHYFRIYFP